MNSTAKLFQQGAEQCGSNIPEGRAVQLKYSRRPSSAAQIFQKAEQYGFNIPEGPCSAAQIFQRSDQCGLNIPGGPSSAAKIFQGVDLSISIKGRHAQQFVKTLCK